MALFSWTNCILGAWKMSWPSLIGGDTVRRDFRKWH